MYNETLIENLATNGTYDIELTGKTSIPTTIVLKTGSGETALLQVSGDGGTTWNTMSLFNTSVLMDSTNNVVGIDSPGRYRVKCTNGPCNLALYRKVG
jgi:hypothetical protein